MRLQVEDIDLLPGLFSGIGDLGATPRAGDAAAHGFGPASRDDYGGDGGAEPRAGAHGRSTAEFEFCQIFRPRGDLGQT